MKVDNAFIKQQLDLQNIQVPDESDYQYIARVYQSVMDSEKVLDEFPDLDSEKIILTMDLKEVN